MHLRIKADRACSCQWCGHHLHSTVTNVPLTDKLFDASDEAATPSFSRGCANRVYRYYVSASLQQCAGKAARDIMCRLPAAAIGGVVANTARRWSPREEQPLSLIHTARIAYDGLMIECHAKLAAGIAEHLCEGERIINSSAKLCRIHTPDAFPLHGGQRLIISDGQPDICPDTIFIAALSPAHALIKRDRKGMPSLRPKTAAGRIPYTQHPVRHFWRASAG